MKCQLFMYTSPVKKSLSRNIFKYFSHGHFLREDLVYYIVIDRLNLLTPQGNTRVNIKDFLSAGPNALLGNASPRPKSTLK